MPKVRLLNSMIKKASEEINVQFVFPGSITLTQSFNQTLRGDYAAKGVGLSSTGIGNIDLTSEIPSDTIIEKAFLYWATLNEGESNSNGTLNGTPITGQLLGRIDIGGLFIDGFRADVTEIAKVTNNLTDFPNSLASPVAIAFGASLVIVYSGNDLPCKTVIINDGIQIFVDDTIVSTTFENFIAAGLFPQAKTTYIVGDGGGNNSAIFNGTTVAEPDAFNSGEGEFWDTLNVDVTGVVLSGATTETASIQNLGFFVLAWIAQVFSVASSGCQGRGISFFM